MRLSWPKLAFAPQKKIMMKSVLSKYYEGFYMILTKNRNYFSNEYQTHGPFNKGMEKQNLYLVNTSWLENELLANYMHQCSLNAWLVHIYDLTKIKYSIKAM
jgi:hypothetical protein